MSCIRPVMIHMGPFGSMERFHLHYDWKHTGGNFPLWLMPEQAIILPVGEKQWKYAKKFKISLKNNDIRALIDNRNETRSKENTWKRRWIKITILCWS